MTEAVWSKITKGWSLVKDSNTNRVWKKIPKKTTVSELINPALVVDNCLTQKIIKADEYFLWCNLHNSLPFLSLLQRIIIVIIPSMIFLRLSGCTKHTYRNSI